MKETLINHPKLKVVRKTGTEGPREDPYSFEEWYVTTPRNEVTIHLGLGMWATLNEAKVVLDGFSEQEQSKFLRESLLRETTGFTWTQLERIALRAASRCRKCGSREYKEAQGYPGEYFTICAKCGEVVGYQFYESEIL